MSARSQRGSASHEGVKTKAHRARHRRRRPRRPVPRRGRGAPSGGRLDRHRRDQAGARASWSARRCGADFVTADFRELLKRPEVNAVIVSTDEHLHVDPVMAALERRLPMLIEKPLATDLAESAQGARRDREGRRRRRHRLHPALPPPLARREGEGAHRRARRRDDGDLARLHEPAGRDRQLQAHRRPRDDLADGDLRHARARHRHVVSGGEEAGRGLCALGRQGARARSTRASTAPPA